MIPNVDNVLLFPLVFGMMVMQKTYSVSKSALVPLVVRTDDELVEANSKLGVIAGVVAAIAIGPLDRARPHRQRAGARARRGAVRRRPRSLARRLPRDPVADGPGARPRRRRRCARSGSSSPPAGWR